MEVLTRVAMGLLIVIPGALIVHLCPNGSLMTLTYSQLDIKTATDSGA